MVRFSLRALSTRDPKRRQSDGWGVGWIADRNVSVFKSANAINREPMRVAQAIQKVASTTTIGHIRRASNPLNLSKKALSGLPHSQPFTHAGWLFCHNGTLAIPREVKAALGPLQRFIKSKNDSEVLFYWLFKTVIAIKEGTPAERVRRSMQELNTLWQKCRSAHPDLSYPMLGLNWVLTDGHQLLSFCYANPQGFRQGSALGHKRQPYFALQHRITPDGIDIASEPWDKDSRWKPIGHSTLLVAKRTKNKLLAKRYRISAVNMHLRLGSGPISKQMHPNRT